MYLVVWREDPANNNSSTDQRIMGRIIRDEYGAYGPAYVIDDPPGQDFAPAVAFDTTQWFVASTNVVSSTRRVDSSTRTNLPPAYRYHSLRQYRTVRFPSKSRPTDLRNSRASLKESADPSCACCT